MCIRDSYLTIDLDCLDPSCFPGTGTPEAGGVRFLQLLDAIRTVSKANIVGADLNELAPMLDISGVSTATACKVLRFGEDCIEILDGTRLPVRQKDKCTLLAHFTQYQFRHMRQELHLSLIHIW